MIDLRKVALLEALLRLPYTFVMPDTLFEDEWLCLTATEKQALCNLGLDVRSLSGELVQRSGEYFNQHAPLKLNDCFALTLAEEIGDCILLTGDGPLRRVAEGNGIEVRGVLWITDELEAHNIESAAVLHATLRVFQDDSLVFLPPDEITRRLRRLARML
ncbi:MAG: type II toxin-antitoxin system VapC family toxin [Dehalococcoidia bacterium]